jgi:hypothetical protein
MGRKRNPRRPDAKTVSGQNDERTGNQSEKHWNGKQSGRKEQSKPVGNVSVFWKLLPGFGLRHGISHFLTDKGLDPVSQCE